MKQMLAIIILAISPIIYANTITTQCVNNGGENSVTINDTSVPANQGFSLPITNTVSMNDLVYPYVGYVTFWYTQCIDGTCTSLGHGQSIPVLPQGYQDNFKMTFNMPALPAGVHTIAFESNAVEYGCIARASATITVI